MGTPELCLRTRYVFDEDGRIVSTHKPRPGRGPVFILVRGATSCAWAIVDELWQIESNFFGWTADEVPEASPIVAVLEDGHAVSVCFCARRASFAAEAGLETAQRFRGRGLGPRVAAAWALAMRASGRTPLYSTSWSNDATRAVARKLGLIPYATTWNLSGQSRPGAYP